MQSSKKFEIHYPITQSIKAIDGLFAAVESLFTEQQFDLQLLPSKQQLKAAMTKGAVWLSVGKQTHRLRRASRVLKPSQTLHFYYDEKVLNAEVPKAQLLADHQDYSLWYKPKGMMSQGSKWGDHCTIARFAQLQFIPERGGFIVHRLDRATDGIIVVGHTKSATQALCEMFATREVNKWYLAVVRGQFPSNLTIDELIDGKTALSEVLRLEYSQKRDLSLLEVKIGTGRKHQIRRHLSLKGYPIIGDRLYGNGENELDLQLTSYRLEFNCPLKNQFVSVKLAQNLRPCLKDS